MPDPVLILVLACVAPFVLSAALTGAIIEPLRRLKIRQVVREDGPETHLKKTGTPSMGGIAFLAALVIVLVPTMVIAHSPLSYRVFYVLGYILAMAAVGFADDYQKVRRGGAYGFGARERIVVEILLTLVLAWLLTQSRSLGDDAALSHSLSLSFIPRAGVLWLIFATFVGVGTSNAVNLTDGLDGLAAGLTALCATALAIGCLASGQFEWFLLSLTLAGVSAGFLWFNASPAKVFMGDVGSLGLGAALAGIALATRLEIVLLIAGFIFVAEALSVIGQVASFKTTGKRILKMAPLHHHFELCGWAEQTVVIRFWAIGAILAAISIAIMWMVSL